MSLVMGYRLGRARGDSKDEQGFTLLELTIAMGLSAFVFAALASVLGSAVRTLALQKARSQANEVATLGLEDLQRLSFNQLVLCTTPTLSSGATDPGLGAVIMGSGCPSPIPAGYEGDPCSGTVGSVPASSFSCYKVGRTMYVRRYIVWTDPTQTGKRLAVFVDWTDTAGHHQVSQQSSLRTPTGAAYVGQLNPTLNTPTASPTTVQINVDGTLQTNAQLSVSVNASGLSGADKVFAILTTIDSSGNATSSSLELAAGGSPTGTYWFGTLTPSNGFVVGEGSQFVTFTGVRSSDGKATSAVSGLIKFCNSVDNCSSSVLPQITGSSVNNGSNVSITASGAQNADIPLSVTTKNLLANDSVSVQFATLGGTSSVPLTASSCTTSNGTTTCTWTGVIPKSAGYGFTSGSQRFYITAAQDKVAGSSVDQGNTTADTTQSVNFS
jgi:type II secretory pathway pseudopilin PulG